MQLYNILSKLVTPQFSFFTKAFTDVNQNNAVTVNKWSTVFNNWRTYFQTFTITHVLHGKYEPQKETNFFLRHNLPHHIVLCKQQRNNKHFGKNMAHLAKGWVSRAKRINTSRYKSKSWSLPKQAHDHN